MHAIPLKDNTKPRATNPEFLADRCQSSYLGIVYERFEDNVEDTDDKPRDHRIKFNILGLPEFVDEWPIASLLGNATRPVSVDELVKIWDVCDINSGLHTFYYEPIFEDRFTGIKNYDNTIDMTEKNVNRIKLPNMEIVLDRHEGASGEKDQDDLDDSKGIVSIKLPGLDIVYSNDDEKITTTVLFDEDTVIEKTVTKTYKDAVTNTYKDTLTDTYEKDATVETKGKKTETVTGDLTLESKANITIKSGAKLNIEAGGPIDLKATGMIKINSAPASIGWCSIPVCPFSGAPHTSGSCPTV